MALMARVIIEVRKVYEPVQQNNNYAYEDEIRGSVYDIVNFITRREWFATKGMSYLPSYLPN